MPEPLGPIPDGPDIQDPDLRRPGGLLYAYQYEAVQAQLLLLCGLVERMPLDDFVRTAEHADAFVPFVDPTLWMKGSRNLSAVIRLARGACEFQKVIRKVKAEAVERQESLALAAAEAAKREEAAPDA